MTRLHRAVLVCGVATDPVVWSATADVLTAAGFDVTVPLRPQSGCLNTEVEFLAPLCDGAVVLGVSGGATLGLELAARGVRMSAAFLHEPAAGSLAPGLLDHVVEGFARDGVRGFGRALYGSRWTTAMTSADEATVERELAMFRAFEPRPPTVDPSSITLTVGQNSPHARYDSIGALGRLCGSDTQVLPGTSHAAHLDNAFREVIADIAPHDR
ncbi:alpha/beta hydrolase [Gordonia sp. zg691]|uniref:alpha/beta hydrolase n=1 Tax=Gordonia jinghuaiqii TaxID=2758710 RepID=UPI0016627CCF|nr:alpha/beta hydrolase [Gordonia jinghuaiqii]MBD0862628.1 alpha/beta hydrolase [Gordonia jinghuaiqii]